FVPVMEVDAAQYAAISREMFVNHHYLEVFNRGQNYLDKPPLIFWLCVISFKLFGVNTVAYKLPSFLFSLLGVYSTFRLAKYLYNFETGLLAALMLYTCQAFFLFNNDVRTDTLLTANVIFGSWQLILFSDSKKWKHLLLGFLGLALAMLSKGPIGVLVPASALFLHFAMKREWRNFFLWQWIAGILFALILLSPMVYGLYLQFGNEGPKFFFWTQSFGRITGENPWRNDAGYFYFIHVLGWSLLPWTIIVLMAIIASLVSIVRKRFASDSQPEYYSLGGFLFPFIALSFSHYKLPHYIFVLYPFAAILAAGFNLKTISQRKQLQKILSITHLIIISGVFALAIIICTIWLPLQNILLWLPAAAGMILCFIWWRNYRSTLNQIILPVALSAIAVNWLLDTHAYPTLLKYQSGSELARIALDEHLDKDHVYFSTYGSYAFEFYFQKSIGYVNADDIRKKLSQGEHFSVIGYDGLMNDVKENNWTPKKIITVNDFHVSQLTTKFLNRNTRDSTLEKVYLIEF
ncbi:MAG: ArnT family glycosyltransferase, partial [Chitinophagales bacterium]